MHTTHQEHLRHRNRQLHLCNVNCTAVPLVVMATSEVQPSLWEWWECCLAASWLSLRWHLCVSVDVECLAAHPPLATP
jgi:hypothetical protein